MSETIGQFKDYINEFLPSRINSSSITTLTNNEMRKIWQQMTSTEVYDSLTTIANQVYYTLPTDCDFETIVENGIMVCDSTTVTSTCNFTSYTYCGPDEDLEGYRYFEGLGQTFGIYPTPTTDSDGLPIRIKYQKRPTLFASTDTSVQFPLDQDYIDLIRFRVMSRIAKSGNNPDIELANNFTMDANEIERKLRMKRANDRVRTPRTRLSYKFDFDE
jgi:hypothetical protein